MAVPLSYPAPYAGRVRHPRSRSADAPPRPRAALLESPFELCDRRLRRATARLYPDRVELTGRAGLRRYHRVLRLADVLYAVPRGDDGLLLQLRGGHVFYFAVDDADAWQQAIEDRTACLAA